MKHNFKFQLGQAVRVLDYDSPRTEHYAAVVRRWLEAYRGNEDPDELEEQYEVELTFNGNKQRHMFLVDDITEDVNGNYCKIVGNKKGNYWLKKRTEKTNEFPEERWAPAEDYWIPIRPNSNTRVETLPGAQNLEEITMKPEPS